MAEQKKKNPGTVGAVSEVEFKKAGSLLTFNPNNKSDHHTSLLFFWDVGTNSVQPLRSLGGVME